MVEEVFDVTNRGCFLVLPRQWEADARIRVGDRIQLLTPEGRVFDTQINAVEIACGPAGYSATIGLPPGLSRSDVPAGTEIWLVDKKAP
jgi:hypothetical protein